MSIQEQIIALLNGDLDNPRQVEELMHVLAVSPEKRSLFVEQVRLSRAFSAAAGAVAPSRMADERIWEGIRAIDAGFPPSAPSAVSPSSAAPSMSAPSAAAPSAAAPSVAVSSSAPAGSLGAASRLGGFLRRFWGQGIAAIALVGVGVGIGSLLSSDSAGDAATAAGTLRGSAGASSSHVAGAATGTGAGTGAGTGTGAIDAGRSAGMMAEIVAARDAEHARAEHSASELTAALAELGSLRAERGRLLAQIGRLRAGASGSLAPGSLAAGSGASGIGGSAASGSTSIGFSGSSNGGQTLGSSARAEHLPEVHVLMHDDLPVSEREWQSRRASGGSAEAITAVKARDYDYLPATPESAERLGGSGPLPVEPLAATIEEVGPWRIGVNNLFRLSLPRVYGISERGTVVTDREVDLSYRMGGEGNGMLTALRLGAAAGQAPFAQVYYFNGAEGAPDTLIEQRPALFYGRAYVAPEIIRSGIVSGLLEFGGGATGIGPFLTVGTNLEASTDASFGPFDGIATHIGVSSWILWTQTGDRIYTSTNLNMQIGASLRF